MVPFGHPLLQLSEQVLVELVELGKVVQDLVQKTLLNHRLPTLMRRLGHRIPEVLQIDRQRVRQTTDGGNRQTTLPYRADLVNRYLLQREVV